MRIIDSPRLWDNRLTTRDRRRPIISHIINILILVLLVSLAILADNLAFGHKTSARHSDSAVKLSSSSTIAKPIDLENLLPDSYNNPSTFLVNKLISLPPPLPSANCSVDACVALTFDDGPNPASSQRIVNAFKFERAQATFFEVGRNIKGHEAYLKLMQAAGDEVGNHSWSHHDLTKLTSAIIDNEINQTQAAIVATGLPAPALFRPPYGDINAPVLKQIHLPVILWNVDPKDWAQKDAGSIVKMVEQQIKPGAIVVMHDKKLTADAVPRILKDLRGKYRFVTVSQLLNLSPNAQGVFIGR